MGVVDALEVTSKSALNSGETYVEVSKKYYELKLFKQLAFVGSTVAKGIVVGSFLLLGVFFATIALAWYLGDHLNDPAGGFLITSGMLLGVALFFFFLRKKIEGMVIKKLSAVFFNKI